ncbi:MAG: 4-vinyl reductase [archaeon]
MEKFELRDKTIFDFDSALISSLGGRMALVHVSLLHDLIVRMEGSFGPSVWDVFYDYSKKSAVQHAYKFFDSEYVKKYLTENDLTADDVFSLSIGILAQYGLGKAEVSPAGLPENEGEVRVHNSSVADYLVKRRGVSSKPSCYYVAGLIAGFASVVYGKDLDAKEEKCASTGSEDCVFRVFPSREKFTRVFLRERGTSGLRG